MTSADGCQTLVLELLEALLNIKEHYKKGGSPLSAAAPPAPTGSTGLPAAAAAAAAAPKPNLKCALSEKPSA